MNLFPVATFRPTTNKLFSFYQDGRRLLLKLYVGEKCQERYERERYLLKKWALHHLPVPCFYDFDVAGVTKPYLVTDYMEGVSLREYLASPAYSTEKKLARLEDIFSCNRNRHSLALQTNDPDFVLFDANTGNIIVTGNGYFHIDFEAPAKRENLVNLISKEMAKFCRWACRDMGRDNMTIIVEKLTDIYADHLELLQRIVELTTSSPLQFVHRLRDKGKKKKNPLEITKYDIADAIRKELQLRQAG